MSGPFSAGLGLTEHEATEPTHLPQWPAETRSTPHRRYPSLKKRCTAAGTETSGGRPRPAPLYPSRLALLTRPGVAISKP
jgi:hypothetical protein